MTALNELMKTVDGLKYSVHASSIMDMQDVVELTGAISINNTKVCFSCIKYLEFSHHMVPFKFKCEQVFLVDMLGFWCASTVVIKPIAPSIHCLPVELI